MKKEFPAQVSAIAKEEGLPSLSEETLKKFGVEADVFEKFPKKAATPEIPGEKFDVKPQTPEQVKITDAENKLANAEANKEYVDKTNQTEVGSLKLIKKL